MKTRLQIWIFIFCLSIVGGVFAQNKYGVQPDKCKEQLSNFLSHRQKPNDLAAIYDSWKWCFDNCPEANLHIYTYGLRVAEHKHENSYTDEKVMASNLIDSVFAKRIKFFPQNLGKVYSDWATSLEKRNASKIQVFEKIEAGFKADPSGLSVKNIAIFFQEITNRNKDTNLQKVFDTYNHLIEAVTLKIDDYTKELDIINKKQWGRDSLSSKEKRTQKKNIINLGALGQVEDVLDAIISEVATCDRLIPLYQKNFDAHKSDGKWLRRAASRLNAKECTDNELYEKILTHYKNINDLKAKNTLDENNWLIIDSIKKAKYLYAIGRTYVRKSPEKAASYAKKALVYSPKMGRAYLLIASSYASSANTCGTDEFTKRMVYVAAANMARRAKAVDPNITASANRYIKSYDASAPHRYIRCFIPSDWDRKYKIKCWINETVLIP